MLVQKNAHGLNLQNNRGIWSIVLATAMVVFLVSIGAGFGIGWGARATQDKAQTVVRCQARCSTIKHTLCRNACCDKRAKLCDPSLLDGCGTGASPLEYKPVHDQHDVQLVHLIVTAAANRCHIKRDVPTGACIPAYSHT